MRYIDIPPPITVVLPNEKGEDGDPKVWSFEDWMRRGVLADPAWGKSTKELFLAGDIRTKVRKANGVLELSDNEWAKLKEVVEAPTGGWNSLLGIELIPFFKAVLNAREADDKE